MSPIFEQLGDLVVVPSDIVVDAQESSARILLQPQYHAGSISGAGQHSEMRWCVTYLWMRSQETLSG